MLEKVNYKGFVWPLIVGIALFLLTPFKPATITIAGCQWRQDLLVWLGSRGHRASTDFLPAGTGHHLQDVPAGNQGNSNAKPWADQQLKDMGPMKKSEKIMLAVFILALVYFYSNYLFASGTAHVVAMYAPLLLIAKSAGVPVMFAAIMLGLTGAIFQSTTHYSCGPATELFAPGYVKQTDWWKMCFI